MQTSSDVQISKDLPETTLEVDHKTKNRLNRSALSPNHSIQQCPAKDSTCKKCYKKGHYTSYCFSKDVSLLSEDNNLESEEDAFLGSLESHGDTQWHATVGLN